MIKLAGGHCMASSAEMQVCKKQMIKRDGGHV